MPNISGENIPNLAVPIEGENPILGLQNFVKFYLSLIFTLLQQFMCLALKQCFSTCGPQGILQWATEHFGKSCVWIFWMLEITSFRPKKPLEFWWRPFFCSFYWRSPVFGQKICFNALQNWFGRKIWVKFLSNTLRVGHGKFSKSKWATVRKRLKTTALKVKRLNFGGPVLGETPYSCIPNFC